jgi:hypothetical protein
MARALVLALFLAAHTAGAAEYHYRLIAAPDLQFGNPFLDSLSMNEAGEVAFETAYGPGLAAVVKGHGGPLVRIAADKDRAYDFRVGLPSIDDLGRVAFLGYANGGFPQILVGDGSVPPEVVYDATGHAWSFIALPPLLNAAGQIVFKMHDYPEVNAGIVVGNVDGAPFETIAPDSMGDLSLAYGINASGETTFFVTANNETRLYRGTTAGVVEIANPSDLAPYSGFAGGRSTVNDAGLVAFEAARYDVSLDTSTGIFTGDGGAVTQFVPTTATNLSFARPFVNDAGDIAYEVTDRTGIETTVAIAVGPDPVAGQVIAVGDTLFSWKVGGLTLGGYNAAGQVAFVASVDPGPPEQPFEIVVRADPAPEPGSAASVIAAIAAIGALTQRARRAAWTCLRRESAYGAFATPISVMMPAISSFGVTSKAGCRTGTPSGRISVSPTFATSARPRSSIGIASPWGVSRSTVEVGAAM